MNLWNNLLNLFFPELCLLCRTPLAEGEKHLCLCCMYRLPRTHYERKPGNPAEQLFDGKVPVEQAFSFLRYEKGGSVQQLVHALKYQDNKELAFYLGRLAASGIRQAQACRGIDLLVPVPLHKRKKRQRGYNQAEWIALGLASVLDIPVDTTGLQRVRATLTQTRKSVYDRWTNVQDVFCAKHPDRFSGKHILLVDDVLTTGSTLGACACAIQEATEARISIFSLAIAER